MATAATAIKAINIGDLTKARMPFFLLSSVVTLREVPAVILGSTTVPPPEVAEATLGQAGHIVGQAGQADIVHKSSFFVTLTLTS